METNNTPNILPQNVVNQEQRQPSNSVASRIKSVRAMIFVESFFGYGHFNIVSTLAKELKKLGVEVAVTSSTFDICGKSFNFQGVTQYKLPPLAVNAKLKPALPNGKEIKTHAKGLPEHYRHLITQATTQTLQEFDPTIIIYELFPFMMHWRRPTSDAVNSFYSTTTKPETICLCRDIIHSRNPEKVITTLHETCSRIMIRGDERFAKLQESQSEWGNIEIPIEYLGNFLSEDANTPKTEIEPQNRLVIFGGGGFRGDRDANFFIESATSILFSQAFQDGKFVIVRNDGLPDSVITEIKKRVGNKAQILPPLESDKFRTLLANSDAAITRGGYNTTFELASLRVPFLVIPRTEREQKQRAEFLKRAKLCEVIPEDNLEPTQIAAAIDGLVKDAALKPIQNFKNDGAKNMAQRIVVLSK